MARTSKASDSEEEMREAFKIFDQDNSGFISAAKLRSVMMLLDQTLTDEQIDDMMKEADVDGNGTIDCVLSCAC